jgi:hypothetical protein
MTPPPPPPPLPHPSPTALTPLPQCMQSGLKNLQSAARACARRERLETTGSGSGSSLLPVQHHAHDAHGAYGDPHSADDSGIGLDELEAEYASAGGDTASYGGASASLSPDDHERGPVKLYPAPVGGRGGYDGRGDMYGQQGGMMRGGEMGGGRERGPDRGGYGGPQGQGQGQMQQRSQYGLQQRLPSIDMGIGAIINRPPGSL